MKDFSNYFALAKSNKDLAQNIWNKITSDRMVSSLQSHLYGLQSKASLYYFGRDLAGAATQGITRGGNQGELAMIRINHARSLVNTQLNLILASKVVMDPIAASNADFKTRAQLILAKAYCEYYWRDRQLAKYFARILEEAIVFGEAFLYQPWNKSLGETTPLPQIDKEGNIKVGQDGKPLMQKSGDFDFRVLSAWNVIRDPYKRTFDELDWIIVETRENKYTLAARYPEDKKLQSQILNAPVNIIQMGEQSPTRQDDPTDDISVFKLWHKRTDVIPEGLEVTVISPDVILERGPLTYDEIPLCRVYSSELFGTPYAYSAFFEILGPQELFDSLNTVVATNQTTFGTQMVAAPDGTNVSPESFGGVKLFKYPAGTQPPSALQLCKSPQEVFPYMDTLVGWMEALMGVNSVARGEPQSGEQSGAALALLEAKAKQQMSTLEGSYLRAISNSGTGIIDTTRRMCPYPRKISIAGMANKSLVRTEEVDKDSFGQIERVEVDIGNPLSQTAAGRQELANMYIQILGPKMTAEELEQVISTGRLEPLTQSLQRELLLICSENESIARGELPPVMADDDHVLHMREHRGEMANPEVRNNPAALEAFTNHMNEHWALYNSVDPARLIVMGQQPPPAMMAPAAPPPGTPGPEPAPEEPGSVAPDSMSQAELPSLPKSPLTGEPPPSLQPSPGVSKA